MDEKLPIAIIGAGPVGLAAAAHLIERGQSPLLIERADQISASTRDWGHVRLFSPWRYNTDPAAVRLLELQGWQHPPRSAYPTGQELYEQYLAPLVQLPCLRDNILLEHEVISISRQGMDKVRTPGRSEAPFVVRSKNHMGQIKETIARAVIDASGTWCNQNPLGVMGLVAKGEEETSHRIHYGIPDILGREQSTYAGATTLVVGAGHSAANSIVALAELATTRPDTTVIWATRGSNLKRVFGGGVKDSLAARGRLGTQLQELVQNKKLKMV